QSARLLGWVRLAHPLINDLLVEQLEFSIPAVQDYGAALKLNDWDQFKRCYYRLFLFFCLCTTDYQRTMYVNLIMMEYWQEKKLPLMDMLGQNPTFFSEESGEIALSMLVNMQPVGTGPQIDVARRYWQCLPLRERTFSVLDTPRNKKHRLISTALFFLVLIFFIFVLLNNNYREAVDVIVQY